MIQVESFGRDRIGGGVSMITGFVDGKAHRILIDYGKVLPGVAETENIDFPWGICPVDAVFFTHYHGDHMGRIGDIPENIPIYMGEVTREVLCNIEEELAKRSGKEGEEHRKRLELLRDDARVHTFRYDKRTRRYEDITDIPGFRIQPFCVDHSAYDAYLFRIEVADAEAQEGKQVVVHTGDFRTHGYRGTGFVDHFVKYFGNAPVDYLIVEGTMMSRQQENLLTEAQMQKEAISLFREHRKVFLICSSTNLDSLASFYQAWKKVNAPRRAYFYTYSKYFAKQLQTFSKTAGNFSGLYRFENVYPMDLKQKERMQKNGFLAVVKPQKAFEKYVDAFAEDVEKPVIIYSMWEGYLNPGHLAYNKEWDEFLKEQERKGIRVIRLHTSGHASAGAIAELIQAVRPRKAILPMHTENRAGFYELPIDEEFRKRIC